MTDLINRRAALEICEKEYQERIKMHDYCGDTVAWNIGGEIKALPSVEAEPVRHGRWIRLNVETGIEAFGYKETVQVPKCSLCGFVGDVSELGYSFCPNCGAKMDKPDPEKTCDTCAYGDEPKTEQPCCGCVDFCNWEAGEDG